MSLLSLITKTAPTWSSGKLTMDFDAVLEDTLDASVTLSDYPIEVGSRSNDHRIKNPIRWQMTGAISNNPFNISVTDFTGFMSEVSSDSGVLAISAGLMAGWASADDVTRASTKLQILLKLMYEGDPFDIDAGDIQLSNMVIESIRRTKDPKNENGLVFSAQLREWQDIRTAISAATSSITSTSGTATASASADEVKKGQRSITETIDSVKAVVTEWFE